ncbi:MAG: tetratricopeptide repeat protein [Bacteroidia bacterium]|nr:tetratricopeptide repeat protein [Bacteroidia bacterium]
MAELDPHIPSRPAAPPSAQRLEAYLAGELPDEVRQEVEAQLGADELLRDAAEGLQHSGGPGAFAGAVGRLRAQARASVRERMHRRETLSRRRLRVMPDPRVLQIGLAVAASVALLFGSLWIFRYRQIRQEPLAAAQPAPQTEVHSAPGQHPAPGPAAAGEPIGGSLPEPLAMGPSASRMASAEDLAAPTESAPVQAPEPALESLSASAPAAPATVQAAPMPAQAQPAADAFADDAAIQPYSGHADAEAQILEAEVSESRKRAEKALPAPMMTYEDSLRGAVLRAQGLADLFDQGMLRMQQGDSAAALDKFLEVLQGSPGHLPASYYAGLLHYRQGRYKAAQPLLETAASNPAASQYPAARLLLARNLIALGRAASARKVLEALAAAGGPEGREAAALLQQLR